MGSVLHEPKKPELAWWRKETGEDVSVVALEDKVHTLRVCTAEAEVTMTTMVAALAEDSNQVVSEQEDEEGLDEVGEITDIARRRQYLKEFGKKSVHNVISRRDNLILSPDKPTAIPKKVNRTTVEAEPV